MDYSHTTQYQARIKKYDPAWNELTYIKEYKEKIKNLYNKPDCIVSPYVNRQKEKNNKFIDAMDKKIMLNAEFKYKIKNCIVRITPIKIISFCNVKCRILGSDKIIFIKKKNIIWDLD